VDRHRQLNVQLAGILKRQVVDLVDRDLALKLGASESKHFFQ
jgi:hypothetical protein